MDNEPIAKQVENIIGSGIMLEESTAKPSRNKSAQTAQKSADQKRLIGKDTVKQKESPQDIKREVNGWGNLITLVAFMGIFRFILVNLVELGWLVEIPLSSYTLKDCRRLGIVFCLNVLRSVICFYVVQFKLFSILYVLTTEAMLSSFIFTRIENRNVSGASYVISIIFDMKLISFIENVACRDMKRFCEFLTFPTLIYKDSYNRKSKTNFAVLGRACAKMILWSCLLCFFIDQHAVPAFYRLMTFNSLNGFLEGFLNFSLGSIILFNIFFRVVFDYGTTIFSEITRFDEQVYGKWWNSQSSEEFWKNWNLPVHLFVKNHIYLPLVSAGFGKYTSSLACFVFSGAVHEYVVSMSLKSFNGWFLVAMIAQIPLHFVTDFVKRRFPSVANIFFWLSFCVIGQPMMMLLIYRTFYTKNEIDLQLNSPYRCNTK